MYDRDESINKGVSELVDALVALKILGRHQCDLARLEKTAHGALKVICEALLSCKANVTDRDHSMNFSFNIELCLLQHIVDGGHELFNVLAHVFLQVVG